jgi:hypothetical protein
MRLPTTSALMTYNTTCGYTVLLPVGPARPEAYSKDWRHTIIYGREHCIFEPTYCHDAFERQLQAVQEQHPRLWFEFVPALVMHSCEQLLCVTAQLD